MPLVEGHGQFGNRVAPDKDGIGAPRYTEVRRSKAADALLYTDMGLAPMEGNYDGSSEMPKHFLPLIPVALLNGVAGIAMGYSTDIQPHDLNDLIAATEDALRGRPLKPLVPAWNR